jgi:hypothetical protein
MKKSVVEYVEEKKIGETFYRQEVIKHFSQGQVEGFSSRFYKLVDGVWATCDYFDPFDGSDLGGSGDRMNRFAPAPNILGSHSWDVAEKAWPQFKDSK